MNNPLVKIRELIKKNKSDAIIISSIPNIIYLTNYSGFSKEEREAFLFITENKQYILTDGRYVTAVKALIPDFKLIEITSTNSVKEILKKLKTKHKINKISFEGRNITHLEYKKLSQALGKMVHLDLDSLRIIKNSDEISKIDAASQLGDKTFDYILKKIHLGMSEKEVANEMEYFIKSQGGDLSFNTIVAFGKNSALPHHVPTAYKLQPDSIVLLDFGIKLNNYCSDMTRTIFFGKTPAEFKKMYEAVLQAQSLAIQQFNNLTIKQLEINGSEIDLVAREHIVSAGYKTIPHSLGHGIGIEVHEAPHLSPKSKDILKEGMVFSIEPGIYIPKFGGVRIEDLAVLEKGVLRLLTHSPKNLVEI